MQFHFRIVVYYNENQVIGANDCFSRQAFTSLMMNSSSSHFNRPCTSLCLIAPHCRDDRQSAFNSFALINFNSHLECNLMICPRKRHTEFKNVAELLTYTLPIMASAALQFAMHFALRLDMSPTSL